MDVKPKKDEEKKNEGLKENISSVFQTSSRFLRTENSIIWFCSREIAYEEKKKRIKKNVAGIMV